MIILIIIFTLLEILLVITWVILWHNFILNNPTIKGKIKKYDFISEESINEYNKYMKSLRELKAI